MLCAVIPGPTLNLAKQQIEAVRPQCDLVELRLDLFAPFELPALKELIAAIAMPVILTLRAQHEGGHFPGTEEQRIARLMELVELQPTYLDLEASLPKSVFQEVHRRQPAVKLIASVHDFEGCPPLSEAHAQLAATGADLHKIAVTPQCASEALSLLRFMQETPQVLAVGMGEHGSCTRILAPLFGAPFTYACPSAAQATAPGQLDVHTLTDCYRYQSLSAQTKIFGLIGDPIEQSPGHLAHNRVMPRGEAVYVKFRVPDGDLASFLSEAKLCGIHGLSVTMPLKQRVLPFVRNLAASAERAGAVNTLRWTSTGLHGSSTDGPGCVDALEAHEAVHGKQLVLLGAGGVCRAVAAEAIQRGAHVTILARRPEQAEQVARDLGCKSGTLAQLTELSYDILVNGTPSPMPVPASNLRPGALVMDLTSRPHKPPLLVEAEARGCTCVMGYAMFINQALGQLQTWFGDSFPVTQARKTMQALYTTV